MVFNLEFSVSDRCFTSFSICFNTWYFAFEFLEMSKCCFFPFSTPFSAPLFFRWVATFFSNSDILKKKRLKTLFKIAPRKNCKNQGYKGPNYQGLVSIPYPLQCCSIFIGDQFKKSLKKWEFIQENPQKLDFSEWGSIKADTECINRHTFEFKLDIFLPILYAQIKTHNAKLEIPKRMDAAAVLG